MRSLLVLFLAVAVMGDPLQDYLQMQFQAYDLNKDHHVTFDDFQLLFKNADADGNGKATVAEYAKGMSSTPERVTALYKVIDTNQDGVLDMNEVKAVFHGYDANGDGTVSRHEFETHYTAMSRTEALWRPDTRSVAKFCATYQQFHKLIVFTNKV